MVDVYKRCCRACLALALLGWLGCTAILAQPPGREAKQLNLKEGETAAVPGTDLTIEARKVSDFTSQGCLGGPIGCPDQVQLEITRGKESKTIVLYVAHSQSQREQGVNEADIFGYKVLLTTLKGKQITLIIKSQ